MANEAEQAIYNRLASAPTFHPASADLFVPDWGLDAGDIVTVKAGENMFNVPIYNMSLNWKGASRTQIQSTGNQERQPLSALKRRQYGGGSASHQEIEELGDGIHADLVRTNNKIGLVVTETQGGNVVNAASIVAAINAAGSSVVIDADHIDLNGIVTAQQFETALASIDTLVGDLDIHGALTVGGNINAGSLAIEGDTFTNVITSASVSQDGRTLTLTPLVGEPINFSKPGQGVITAITKSGQTWKPALFTYGGFEVDVYASGTDVGTYSDTIEVDAAYAYSAGWSTGYDDGVLDGEAEFTQATVTPQGASETVYVSDSTGTEYYKKSSTSYNRIGTSETYKFYGSLYAPEGSGPSWVVKGTGTWYLWTGDHRNAYLYHVGSSVTPVDSNSKITIKSDTRYQAGTPDTTTYYTRSTS